MSYFGMNLDFATNRRRGELPPEGLVQTFSTAPQTGVFSGLDGASDGDAYLGDINPPFSPRLDSKLLEPMFFGDNLGLPFSSFQDTFMLPSGHATTPLNQSPLFGDSPKQPDTKQDSTLQFTPETVSPTQEQKQPTDELNEIKINSQKTRNRKKVSLEKIKSQKINYNNSSSNNNNNYCITNVETPLATTIATNSNANSNTITDNTNSNNNNNSNYTTITTTNTTTTTNNSNNNNIKPIRCRALLRDNGPSVSRKASKRSEALNAISELGNRKLNLPPMSAYAFIRRELAAQGCKVPTLVSSVLDVSTANPKFVSAQESFVYGWLSKEHEDIFMAIPSETLPAHIRELQRTMRERYWTPKTLEDV